jgi:hypothetical protein
LRIRGKGQVRGRRVLVRDGAVVHVQVHEPKESEEPIKVDGAPVPRESLKAIGAVQEVLRIAATGAASPALLQDVRRRSPGLALSGGGDGQLAKTRKVLLEGEGPARRSSGTRPWSSDSRARAGERSQKRPASKHRAPGKRNEPYRSASHLV